MRRSASRCFGERRDAPARGASGGDAVATSQLLNPFGIAANFFWPIKSAAIVEMRRNYRAKW